MSSPPRWRARHGVATSRSRRSLASPSPGTSAGRRASRVSCRSPPSAAAATRRPRETWKSCSRESGMRLAVVDAGPLYAAADADDDDHQPSLAALSREDLRLVVPALVVA